MTYHVGITKRPGDPLYHVAVYKTHHDFMIANPERHEAENAEELMDTLFKIYDWQPEEWDGYDPGEEK